MWLIYIFSTPKEILLVGEENFPSVSNPSCII